MPSRKSDPARRSDVLASAARFAPIEDKSPAPTPAHEETPSRSTTMDAAMPPHIPQPHLPPPDATPLNPPRIGSAEATSVAEADASLPQTTPSDKGKEREEGKTGGGGHPKEAVTIPIEELQLPKSIITRLAKGVLPPNTQIQANAILAMTKSATVFINHLANAANESTMLQNKKTIMPADVFRALDDIEFGFMRERVEAEFNKFNETQTTKRSAYRKKVAAAKKAARQPGDEGADTSMAGTDGDTTMMGADTTMDSIADSTTGSQRPRAKKPRTDGESSRVDVDEDVNDASDLESVSDEVGDDEDDEAQEDEDEDDQDGGDDEEERDELDEREDRLDDDEALDDGNNSD